MILKSKLKQNSMWNVMKCDLFDCGVRLAHVRTCGRLSTGAFRPPTSPNQALDRVLKPWNSDASHDISWHIITYHDISWHIMIYHDISWHIMIYHGTNGKYTKLVSLSVCNRCMRISQYQLHTWIKSMESMEANSPIVPADFAVELVASWRAVPCVPWSKTLCATMACKMQWMKWWGKVRDLANEYEWMLMIANMAWV
jgi:hypothetical protein